MTITNLQAKAFLNDMKEKSETFLLIEGKEKDEIIEKAKAKGITLQGNTDLVGFKNVYAFANKKNKNNVILPKEVLLKALPTIIGKPVDIDHNRGYVIGHYIDVAYREEDDAVVTYGLIYKSNFVTEMEEIKKQFEEKKLATSFEIWCPQNKRQYNEDGSYNLTQMELAGGAILLTTKPAFEDAKVLSIAKENIEKMAKDLVFATDKYNVEEIINSNVGENKEMDKLEEPKKEPEEAKKLSHEERKNLPDDDFAVVFEVKNKKTGQPRKIRMFPMHDAAHVKNVLARLGQEKVKNTLKKHGINIEDVKNKIEKKAKELNIEVAIEVAKIVEIWNRQAETTTITELKDDGTRVVKQTTVDKTITIIPNEIPLADQVSKATKEEELNATIVKLEGEKLALNKIIEESNVKVTELSAQLKQVQDALEKSKIDNEIEKQNLKKIYYRKVELGGKYSPEKDEDLLDDTKFELLKVKKEKEEILKSNVTNIVVGDKKSKVDLNNGVDEEKKKLAKEVAERFEEINKGAEEIRNNFNKKR